MNLSYRLKAAFIPGVLSTLLISPALATPCNTGVTGNAVTCGAALLPDGSPDLHWSVTPVPVAPSGAPIAAPPPPGDFVPATAHVSTTAWLPNDTVSGWITPSSSDLELGGQYVYRTSFTGDQAFGGRYLSDNEEIEVFLNALLVPGFPHNGPSSFVSAADWTNFVVADGLSAGLNVLDFVIRNRGFGGIDSDTTQTGFRAEFFEAAAVPEPSTLSLLALGALALFGSRSRYRGKAAGQRPLQ